MHRALHPINRALDFLERQSVPQAPGTLPHPPVFLIGPPRSGTTLLYQTLVNAWDVGFFTNLHGMLYGGTTVVDRLVEHRVSGVSFSYESEYGNMVGAGAPSEAGNFWYRWFDRAVPGRLRNDEVSLAAMRRVVGAMIVRRDRPVVFKNVYNSIRLAPLAETFPEARFVVIRRDPVMTAQSILLARQRAHGSMDAWWSVPLPDMSAIRGMPVEQQAVRQVCGILGLIREASDAIGPERFFEVRYEEFCQDTHATLAGLQAWLARSGCVMSMRHSVPRRFRPSDGTRLPTERMLAIRSAVREYCYEEREGARTVSRSAGND